MLRRVLTDYRFGVLGFFQSKSGVFWNLFFPVGVMLLLGTIFGGNNESSPELRVVDLSRTDASSRLVELLPRFTGAQIELLQLEESAIDGYVMEHSIPRVLVIPRGFEAVVDDQGALVALDYRASAQPTSFAVLGGIHAAAGYMDYELQGMQPRIEVRMHEIRGSGVNPASFYVPGVFGIAVMYSGMFGMGLSVGMLRRAKIFKKFATTPFRRWEWILSQTGVLITITVASGALIVATGTLIWDLRLELSPMLAPLLLLGVLCFASLGSLIGSTGDSLEGSAAGINAIALPMMFLSGSFLDIDIMPSVLRFVARLLPLTYLNAALRDVMIYENVRGGLTNLGILAGMAAVLLALGSYKLKWEET